MSLPSFTRRMEAAKRDAIHHRNMGRHVGASAKGWDFTRPSDPDDYRTRAQIAREQLKLDIQTIWNTYQSALLNIRHREDFSEIPF